MRLCVIIHAFREDNMKIEILTMLWAMVPVAELRFAIPFGVVAGLSVPKAMILAIIGNCLPVPVLVLFTTRVFAWLRIKSERLNSFVARIEEKGKSKIGQVEKYKFWGLMILVAIPLPGTGAWTGSLVAALMEMDLKKAIPPIFLGVLLAGIIVSMITYGIDLAV